MGGVPDEGSPSAGTTAPAPPMPQVPQAPTPPPPGLDPGSRRNLFVIVGILLVLALVVAVLVVTNGGNGSATKTSATSTPPRPSATPVPPTGLTKQADAFSVTLNWTQPSGGPAVQGYNIYRDGSFVGNTAATVTTYVDSGLSPGHSYTYEVEAAGANKAVSGRVSVTVKTPVPPLAAARLSGNYNVVGVVVSKSGFTSYPPKVNLGWHFKPLCATGPCNVAWSDLNESSFRATLKRSFGNYSGSDSGNFNSRCASATVTSTLTLQLHVAKAAAKLGAWQATKLVGTLTQHDVQQLGCVAASATIRITATLLG